MYQHPPRPPVPPASDRPAWDPARLDAVTLRDLRDRGRQDLGSPWPALLAHAYARYFRDGDRDGYEQLVFAREYRISRAAVLAAVTLDPMWIDEVADGMILLCEQSSWCWPAHDDTFTRHGAVLPTVTDPYLDLGAGEVAAQLGWIDHLLGAALDERVPGLPARIRHECDRRVLTPDEQVAHESQGLGRLLRALTDRDWLTAGPGTSPLPRDVWFASTQVLVDPGRPTYTGQTLGPGRYAIRTMRSDWHNVPRIRGTRQSHGRHHAARRVSAVITDDTSALTLDLAAAYPRTDVIGWQRTAGLDRRTGAVTVRDAWEPAPGGPDGPTLIHLVLAGRVESGAGWARIEALDDAGTVELGWEPAGEPAGVTVHRLADPLLREVWGDRLTRLDIDVTALGPVGSLALNVKEQR